MTHISIRRLLPALALVVAALASAPAGAGPYSSFVVFGDSLSDNGNNAAAGLFDPASGRSPATPTFPRTPTPRGTYSNGPVWASDFAAMIGLPLAPSLAGGTDFAFGGATTGTPGPGPGGFPFSLLVQSTPVPRGHRQPRFAERPLRHRRRRQRRACGAHRDRRRRRASRRRSWRRRLRSPPTSARSSMRCRPPARSTSSSGTRRTSAWRRQWSPAAATAGLATFLAASMNSALAARLAGEAGVTTFDIFGLGTQIAANPALFGFTNVSDACGAVAGAELQPVRLLGRHPSDRGSASRHRRRVRGHRRARAGDVGAARRAAWRRSARCRVGARGPAAPA